MDKVTRTDKIPDKDKSDATSVSSDYIVIDAGSDSSQPTIEVGTYSYLSARMLDEIDSSDPDETSLKYKYQNGDIPTNAQSAVSVEEELDQREKKAPDVKPSKRRRRHRSKYVTSADGDAHAQEEVDGDASKETQGEPINEVDNAPGPSSEGDDGNAQQTETDSTGSGDSLLIWAVQNDAPHMIDELIDESPPLTIYCALLLSIQLGREPITKMFVKHPKYDTLHAVSRMVKLGTLHKHKPEPKSDDSGDPGGEDERQEEKDTDVSEIENTPIMLASLRNQFEVVSHLMALGETIEEPHPLECDCEECQEQTDEIRAAKTRLNTYRALACDAYVALASKDPIHRAFELRQKFQKLANNEKHYKAAYLELADQCRDLSSKILDKVQDGDELNTILNEPYGYDDRSFDNLARLKLAIRNDEKKFVAHPACQKILTTIWMGDLNPAWVDGVAKSLLFFLVLTAVYPFIAIGYIIHPMNKTAPFLRTPLVKFAASTSAFLIFVAILMLASFTEVSSTGYRLSEYPRLGPLYKEYVYMSNETHIQIQDMYVRVHSLRTLTVMLCVWLLGMIWENVKKIVQEGTNYFTDNMFNIINFTSLLLYVVSFGFRFHALYEVEASVQFFAKAGSWGALADNDSLAIGRMYWLDADRTNWHPYESAVVSEAFFSLASILSITKITYVFTISERIGPLLLSLAKMLEDVFAFMILFVFIIVAFVVGFHNLYWYYYSSVGTTTIQGSTFTSATAVVEFFFWSNFGLVNLESDTFDTSTGSLLTSIVAYVLFALYNWMMVIILINMLIAMMSRSYEVISDMEDTEWKFARTKLFLEYMRDDSTVASPYNLLPTWKGVYLLHKSFADDWCYRLAGRVPRKPREVSIKKFATKNKKTRERLDQPQTTSANPTRRKAITLDLGPSDNYCKAIVEVIKRFCETGGSSDNSEDGVDQVQCDLSGLRKDMMTNTFRQDRANALMKAAINKVETDVLNTREGLTKQHTDFKAQHQSKVVEMKSTMSFVDQHISEILEKLTKCVDSLEQKLTENIETRTSQLQSQMTNVRYGVTEINDGLMRQGQSVTKIQGTLLRQEDDVSRMQGTLTTLHSDVHGVQSSLSNNSTAGGDEKPSSTQGANPKQGK